MFVQPSRLKTQGAVFSTVALLALGACDDPVNQTDLRPEGAPEVLAVLVNNDPGLFFETATFCKQGDAKRPGTVAAGLSFELLPICDLDLDQPAGSRDDMDVFTPGTVEDATPIGWYTRVMFDELLDPNVEDLIEITEDSDNDPATPETGTGIFTGSLLATQPVTLLCAPPGGGTAVPVAYDGYYSPSGNAITWPLGPSLFITPQDPSVVATGSACTLELKDSVVDKDNTPVPADQRGTFSWSIAALAFTESVPAPAEPGEEEIIVTDAPVILAFNAFIDAATLDAGTIDPADGEFEIREGAVGITDCAMVEATGTIVAGAVAPDADDPQALDITLAAAAPFIADRMYAITFKANTVADVAGGPGAVDEFTLCFLTEAP